MVMTTDIRFGIAGNREDPLDKSDSGTELSNGSASAVRIIGSGPRRIGTNIRLPGSTSIKNKVKIFTINLIFTITFLVTLLRWPEKSPARSVSIAVDRQLRLSAKALSVPRSAFVRGIWISSRWAVYLRRSYKR